MHREIYLKISFCLRNIYRCCLYIQMIISSLWQKSFYHKNSNYGFPGSQKYMSVKWLYYMGEMVTYFQTRVLENIFIYSKMFWLTFSKYCLSSNPNFFTSNMWPQYYIGRADHVNITCQHKLCPVHEILKIIHVMAKSY